jgi:hypothetical protein
MNSSRFIFSFVFLALMFGCHSKKEVTQEPTVKEQTKPEEDLCHVLIPNTVNSEDDALRIQSQCSFYNFTFTIYDRWGNSIYKTEKWPAGGKLDWDFSKVVSDVYIYTMSYSYSMAAQEHNGSLTGHISVIR